jgi:hypothetical protein
MNRKMIIQNIMINYGKYGITEEMVNGIIDSGLESGANYDLIYLDLMKRIGELTGEEFVCTSEDMARAYNVPVETIYKMIEKGREELIAAGENPDEYFKEVPINRFMM